MTYNPFASVPAAMNVSSVSPELERETAFYIRWGYLVIDDALNADQVEVLRSALDDTFARNRSTFTHQLLEEDDRFAFLLDHEPVLSRMKAILGTCVQLHSATARTTMPGEQEQSWHRDHPWPIDPRSTPYGAFPSQINCGYYVDELTEENGPIVIVPGSHRVPFLPPVGHVRFPNEKRVLAKPGQAVLFDGSLFHRGAANRSNAARRVCLMCYQNAWMKSRETFAGARMRKLREAGSPEVKLLLGEVERW